MAISGDIILADDSRPESHGLNHEIPQGVSIARWRFFFVSLKASSFPLDPTRPGSGPALSNSAQGSSLTRSVLGGATGLNDAEVVDKRQEVVATVEPRGRDRSECGEVIPTVGEEVVNRHVIQRGRAEVHAI